MWKFKRLKVFILLCWICFVFSALSALNTDIRSLTASSVDRMTGDVNLAIPLLSVQGRNGLDIGIAAQYTSNVKSEVETLNKDMPTGLLGVGWSLSLDKIIVNHNKTAQRFDDIYYFSLNGAMIRLYRTGTDTLNINQEDKIVYTYSCHNYKTWKILYYTDDNRWTVETDTGITYEFGNNDNSRQYSIKYGNNIYNTVRDNKTYRDENGNIVTVPQSLFTDAWNLSRKISCAGDEVNYEYLNIKERLGQGTLTYTKASYLKRIYDSTNREAVFQYNEKDPKEYADPNVGVTTENIDPAQYDENNLPAGDAYQEIFKTKYLNTVEFYISSKLENTIEFEYELRSHQVYDYLTSFDSSENPDLANLT